MTLEKDTKKTMLQDLEMVHGEDGFVDVTERVECYEEGKTWECDCGQGIGVSLNRREIDCASCGKTNIDLEWTEREAKDTDDGRQTTFGDF